MKMKKLMAMLIGVSIVVGLVSCGGSNKEATGNASDDVKTISFAHTSAENTSTNEAVLKFKEVVEANSNGKLKVNVYPNAQLGGDRELAENVQNGSVTAMVSSPAPQVNFVQSATIFDSPFVFQDLEHARAVFTDPDFVAAISKEYEANGFHFLGAAAQGFRTLTANKKITKVEDLKGLTIRTMENKYHLKTWELLGANPTPLAFNELYTALQQGTVDAQENPVELVYSQKFYEQQKYIMDTNHIVQSNTFIMNKAFYDSLSDDLKKVIDDAAKQTIDTANKKNDENTPKYIDAMKQYGCEFVEIPEESKKKFIELASPVLEEIKKAVAPEVYDTYFKAIEKYKK